MVRNNSKAACRKRQVVHPKHKKRKRVIKAKHYKGKRVIKPKKRKKR